MGNFSHIRVIFPNSVSSRYQEFRKSKPGDSAVVNAVHSGCCHCDISRNCQLGRILLQKMLCYSG